jgi:hypothetical protein
MDIFGCIWRCRESLDRNKYNAGLYAQRFFFNERVRISFDKSYHCSGEL